jgi:hypothetical protein
LEIVRDTFHQTVDDLHITGLSWGVYTSAVNVMLTLFTTSDPVVSSQILCTGIHEMRRFDHYESSLSCCVLSAGTNEYMSISNWIHNFTESSQCRCDVCNNLLTRQYNFVNIPEVLVFAFEDQKLNIDKEIQIIKDDKSLTFGLKGLIYFGNYHYTSCVVVNNQVWFHDGYSTGIEMIYEGELQHMMDLYTCRRKKAHLAIYAKMST